jgi:hypothetical protein
MKNERPTELPPEIAAKLEKRKRFPRARRWLFNFAAALSLILFVGNYWLWVRSVNGIWDELGCSASRDAGVKISSYDGIGLVASRVLVRGSLLSEAVTNGYQSGTNDQLAYLESPLPKVAPAFGGFRVFSGTSSYGTNKSHQSTKQWTGFIVFPHWFLQLLFAILPLWWLGRFALRWSERKGGHSA